VEAILNQLIDTLFAFNGWHYYLLQYLLRVPVTGYTLVKKNSYALLRTCATYGFEPSLSFRTTSIYSFQKPNFNEDILDVQLNAGNSGPFYRVILHRHFEYIHPVFLYGEFGYVHMQTPQRKVDLEEIYCRGSQGFRPRAFFSTFTLHPIRNIYTDESVSTS
jgi:hypothetical protein